MNNNWEYKKIGDICIVERGGSPRPINQFITDDENGINWIKIGDTTESMYITETAQKIKPEGMKKSRYVQPGDFLLSNSMSFGRPYILKIDGCIHDGWLVLRDKDDLFDKRFLYYYLSSKTTYEKFKSMAVGGVVNNLNSEMVRKVDVPIPSKMEQAKTADVLDKLNSVIVMYQQEIQKLDKLIQARFVEMFGSVHDGRFEMKTLPEIVMKERNAIKRGPFGGSLKKQDFVEEGYLVYEQKHAIYEDFEYEKYYITKKKYEDMIAFKVIPGDLIVSCSGTLGRIAEVPNNAPEGIINQALLKLSLDQTIMKNKFFVYQFRNKEIQDILFGFSRGSGIPNMPSMNEIKKVKFLCPPIDLQNQFAIVVEQINKSKFEIQKSLEKTQLLFDSLMQEYFG